MKKIFYIYIIILHFVCIFELIKITSTLSAGESAKHHLRLRPLLKFKNKGQSFNGILLSTIGTVYNRQQHKPIPKNDELPDERNYRLNYNYYDDDSDDYSGNEGDNEKMILKMMSLGDIISLIKLKRKQRIMNTTDDNDNYSGDEENSEAVTNTSSFIEPVYFGLKRKRPF